MKKMVQIVGAKEVANKVVELTCIPYTSAEVREKKKSMMSMAMGGMDIAEMVQKVQGEQKQLTKIYISRDEWINELHNRLYSTLSIDIELDKELN